MKRQIIQRSATACALSLFIASAAMASPWKFGVMADTQWIGADDGLNPNSVSVGVIKQLNRQFINHKVKFVIQTGDLEDTYNTNAMNTTAIFRQDLYNAGIGFWPLRGNHESSQEAANQFVSVFPQTTDSCRMNLTPNSAFSTPNPDTRQPNPIQKGSAFCVGFISATPAAPTGFTGLDYAFDYENARFILLDQFTPTTGTSHKTLDDNQVAWVDGQLSGRPANSHAFVYGHKAIISQNHTDGLFGLPSDQTGRTNTFVKSLANNGVRIYMGGHDHMHNRAIVASPDHTANVQNIVMASDSSKFYIPYGTAGYTARTVNPDTKAVTGSGTLASADPAQTNDYIYNVLVAGNTTRETPVAQELNTIGYYIYTVDGPRVTADYYSATINATLTDGEYLISSTPKMKFEKRETFGYNLNGHEYLVPQGESYTAVNETYNTTTARILGGANGSTATDSAGRRLTRDVNTGWSDRPATKTVFSAVFTLWGMADLSAKAGGDTYTLSMSYDPSTRTKPGNLGLVTMDKHGHWVNAVNGNVGGKKKYVKGPWKAEYPLGTYGVDPATKTAWAVINHSGDFAVAKLGH